MQLISKLLIKIKSSKQINGGNIQYCIKIHKTKFQMHLIEGAEFITKYY